jgi:probable phosphoglycerate mutase
MIYLFRHGAVDAAGRRFVGQWDVPLNREGERQARYWRDRFRDIPWAGVWSSDLERARRTAEIISGVSAREIPELRELHLGEWEGRLLSEVRERWPAQWRRRGERMATFRPPGGESFADLQRRAMPAFRGIATQPGPLLVVAHAGVNRVILCRLLAMPVAALFQLGQDHGGLNRIDPARRPFRVVSVNWPPGAPGFGAPFCGIPRDKGGGPK